MSKTIRRLATVAAAGAAFTLVGVGSANAITVTVPGTPVTNPCSATADTKGNSGAVPPVVVTFETSCKIG